MPPIPESGGLLFDDNDEEDIRNFFSFFLKFSSIDLPVISLTIAAIISKSFTSDERIIISNILSTIAINVFLINAQERFVSELKETQADIEKERVMAFRIQEILKRIDYLESQLKKII